MPILPDEVNRAASVRVPLCRVEKLRSPLPVLKFWVRMLVMAPVLVALVMSLALKVRREAVDVADARLERYA